MDDEQAVVIVNETSFIKKGTRSADVKHQHSGMAERIENRHGILMAYATPKGHTTFLDQALFRPQEWIAGCERGWHS